MMTFATLRSFGRGTNAHIVESAGLRLWFSYATVVAFQVEGNPRVVHENVWSRTTGRHLHEIDGGKEIRVNADEFKRLWDKQTR